MVVSSVYLCSVFVEPFGPKHCPADQTSSSRPARSQCIVESFSPPPFISSDPMLDYLRLRFGWDYSSMNEVPLVLVLVHNPLVVFHGLSERRSRERCATTTSMLRSMRCRQEEEGPSAPPECMFRVHGSSLGPRQEPEGPRSTHTLYSRRCLPCVCASVVYCLR